MAGHTHITQGFHHGIHFAAHNIDDARHLEATMRQLLENLLMIGQPTSPDTPLWALLLTPLLVAAVVLRRTPRG